MEQERFLAIINKYGEENVLGFGFDNSAAITFGPNDPFSLEKYYVDDIHAFKFPSVDFKGNPYFTIKIIEDIQSIIIKDERYSLGVYDRIDIRG